MHPSSSALVELLHLADSALPIGGAAHSFGMETLVQEDQLTVDNLESFLCGYLEESGACAALFCRAAHQMGVESPSDVEFHPSADWQRDWELLNAELSARMPAQESRKAACTLGRRFLRLISSLEPGAGFMLALRSEERTPLATAFGLAGGMLHFNVEYTVQAYLHSSAAALLSAAQRLLPLGQHRATSILWHLKPGIISISAGSREPKMNTATTFAPMVDLASMRHPNRSVRLFVS